MLSSSGSRQEKVKGAAEVLAGTGGNVPALPGERPEQSIAPEAAFVLSSGLTAGMGVAASAMVLQVMVVDDDEGLRKACGEVASAMGCAVIEAKNVPAAQAILKFQKIDLLLLDLKLPGDGGLALLAQVKTQYPDTSVVVMTAFATVTSAVEAMQIGAADYLTKPFRFDDLKMVIARAGKRVHFHEESRQLRERLRTTKGMGGLVGLSPEMEKLYRILSKVAFSTHPVLILGESGTGKETVAHMIHSSGPNAKKPFIALDCALSPAVIEGELFGYVKGAFPGAHKSKEGALAAVHGGTILLDEIGELPADLQTKLLRALQEKEVRPMGGTQTIPMVARVLAATNRDLAAMVEGGRFRKDLYYRLNVVNLRMPLLRDRKQDIHALVLHFLEKLDREAGLTRSFSDDAMRVLMDYEWPGNVRELENTIARAAALSSGPVLHLGDLPTQLQDFRMHRVAQTVKAAEADEAAVDGVLGMAQGGLHERRGGIVSIATLEKDAILGTIQHLKGDKLMAAKLLGIGKTTLYRKLKEYGISEAGEALN